MLLQRKMLAIRANFLFWVIPLLLLLAPAPSIAQDNSSFSPDSAEYLWPTNASHALSGVFSETRTGHFHAALDIKTWGRRGYPVYATRAGKLHRIAIGPTGYGKVLYLKHNDGSYSVYAHLLRFNDQLRSWSDSLRLSRNINSFDMVVDSLDIRFEQGDQIALSGASGIGPPHLHFELRTPDEEPFNPLLTNLKIRDTISPTYSGLAVLPLSINSTIEGKNQIVTINPSRGSVAADFGSVRTAGPVGLAIDVFDQSNGVPNVYAVYEIKMKVNGREVFSSKVNQFSYAETGQLNIDRVYPLLQSTGKGYQRLFVADGNTLSFYNTAGNKGRLNLPLGQHDIQIEVKDFYGNTRQARLTLNVVENTRSPVEKRPSVIKEASNEIHPNSWTWFNDWVNIPADDFEQLSLTPLFSSPINPPYYNNGNTVSVDLSRSPQFYFRTSPYDFFITRRVQPDEPSYLVSPDERAFATFSRGTFYDTTSVAIARKKTSNGATEVSLMPNNQPIDKSYLLRTRLDSSQLADSCCGWVQRFD